MKRFLIIALSLLSSAAFAAPTLHLELTNSYPEVDSTVTAAPIEIWLEFSMEPDTARSSFSIAGPDGAVALGKIHMGKNPKTLLASVEGEMPPGSYTVSWVGAPIDDHSVMGRHFFTVAGVRW